MEGDWVLYTDTVAKVLIGIDDPAIAERYAQHMRDCVEPETMRAFNGALENWDVSAVLHQVAAPTLVLHNRRNGYLPVDAGRRLAAAIPDAQFSVIDDMTYRQLPAIAAEFVGEDEQATPTVAPPEASTFRTVLFTDVEGSTALTQRLGDAKAREVLREHERITREVLKQHGGAEVKTMGDGFMTSFTSVTRAVECAIALQRAFAEWNADAGAHHDAPLRVRIGLNAGEPIEEEGPDGRSDLFGATVILAARIAAHAQGGEILASLAVRELCAGKGFLFADTGEVTLKGFEEPVRLFEVRWREDA